MVSDSALYLQAATTIATRFLAIRRGGDPLELADNTTPIEPQLLNYLTVSSRVIPLIASAYALTFTSHYMKSMAVPAGLGKSTGGASLDEKQLKTLHATCAGLKAFRYSFCCNVIFSFHTLILLCA